MSMSEISSFSVSGREQATLSPGASVGIYLSVRGSVSLFFLLQLNFDRAHCKRANDFMPPSQNASEPIKKNDLGYRYRVYARSSDLIRVNAF